MATPATPNSMPKTDPLAGMSETSRGLYVDPTPAFKPALEFIDKQRTQANERYAQNKADIANIFGNLTQVNKESQARVNQQFEKSIADQQMATAERTAAARMGQQQTQQAAIQAMDERGGGPMGNLMASPANVAAERGIADSNAYQQIWEGLQGSIQQQTQQDLLAAQRGLGYQQVEANRALQRSLEDVLMGLSGQETGVRSDLAQAVLGQRGKVRDANYNEILQRQAQQAAAANAAVSANARIRAAELAAQNRLDVERLKQEGRTPNIGSGALGAAQLLQSEGRTSQQIASFLNSLDSVDVSSARNAAEAYSLWLSRNVPTGGKARQRTGISAAEQLAARQYFDGLRYTGPVKDSQLPNQGFIAPRGPVGTPTNPVR